MKPKPLPTNQTEIRCTSVQEALAVIDSVEIDTKDPAYCSEEFLEEQFRNKKEMFVRSGGHKGNKLIVFSSIYGSNAEIIEASKWLGKQSFMTKVTPMLKTMLDKGGRTLYKAGYLNGDLELTEEGQSALNSIIFNENKEALVTLAQEALDEEKADR